MIAPHEAAHKILIFIIHGFAQIVTKMFFFFAVRGAFLPLPEQILPKNKISAIPAHFRQYETKPSGFPFD